MAREKRQKERKPKRERPQKERSQQDEEWLDESEPVNAEHEKMLDWLQTVKFRKKMLNGVDEQDVWRKLEELNQLYEASLLAERARYDALLDEHTRAANQELVKYQRAVKTIKAKYDAMKGELEKMERRMPLEGWDDG